MVKRGSVVDRPDARESVAQDARQPCAQEGESQARDDLFGPEMDGHHGVQEAQQPAGEHRDDEPEPGVPRRGGHGESGHGPEQHHPLDPEVQDTGTLGEDLADGREQQDRPAGDPGRQDEREIDHVGAVAVASAGRPTRTR